MGHSGNSTDDPTKMVDPRAGNMPQESRLSDAGETEADGVILRGRPLVRKERSRKPFHPSITEEQVSELVETFYGRIREHPRLSVLFAKGLTQSWTKHLDVMKGFWRSMLMQTSEYGGRPIPAHMQIEGLTPDDFAQWLDLFRSTAEEVCPPAAAELYIDRAETIAQNLQSAVFFKGQIAPSVAFRKGVLTEEWAKKLRNCPK